MLMLMLMILMMLMMTVLSSSWQPELQVTTFATSSYCCYLNLKAKISLSRGKKVKERQKRTKVKGEKCKNFLNALNFKGQHSSIQQYVSKFKCFNHVCFGNICWIFLSVHSIHLKYYCGLGNLIDIRSDDGRY